MAPKRQPFACVVRDNQSFINERDVKRELIERSKYLADRLPQQPNMIMQRWFQKMEATEMNNSVLDTTHATTMELPAPHNVIEDLYRKSYQYGT